VSRLRPRLSFFVYSDNSNSSHLQDFPCLSCVFTLSPFPFRVPALASVARRPRDGGVRQMPTPRKGPQVSKRRLVCRVPLHFFFFFSPFPCEALLFQIICAQMAASSMCKFPLRFARPISNLTAGRGLSPSGAHFMFLSNSSYLSLTLS
jgi:hypothetical protein